MMRILAWFLIGLGVGALIAQAFLVTGWPLVLLGIAAIAAGVALLVLPGVRKHTVPVSSTPGGQSGRCGCAAASGGTVVVEARGFRGGSGRGADTQLQ